MPATATASASGVADGPVRVDVLSDVLDLGPFADVWTELFRSTSAEPSTSLEWTQAMLNHHVAVADRFVLLRLVRGGEVVGFVPLVARGSSVVGQRIVVLSPLSALYGTHASFLVRGLDAHAVEALVRAVACLDLKWDVFRMPKVLAEGPLPDFFRGAAAIASLDCDVHYTSPAYLIPLLTSYDEYLASRSAKFRNHLRRMTRHLEGAGKLTVSYVRNELDFDVEYESLLEIERRSWKHEHGTSISAVPRQTAFYRAMGRGAAAQGRLDLQIMRSDDRPIAHNLGYIHSGTYYYLKTSYDERFRPYSPATVLRARLIASLIDRGIRRFDFMAEPYEWERQWTDVYRWHMTLTLYNSTFKARAVRWLTRLRHRGGKPTTISYSDPIAVKAPIR